MKKWLLGLMLLALLIPFSALGEGEQTSAQDAAWYELSPDQSVIVVRLPVEKDHEWRFDFSDPERLELITMETTEEEASRWIASFRIIGEGSAQVDLMLSSSRTGEEPIGISHDITLDISDKGTMQVTQAVEPKRFDFMSGAGGWSTELTVNPDGSFTGLYHDSEMGVTGDGYPNGSYYYCLFSGHFSDFTPVDEYTTALTLADIQMEEEPGKEEITEGIRYIAAEPYGMETGKSFLLYAPETPIDGLSEEFLSWWPYRFGEEKQETLGCWGLLNQEMGYGFFCCY